MVCIMAVHVVVRKIPTTGRAKAVLRDYLSQD